MWGTCDCAFNSYRLLCGVRLVAPLFIQYYVLFIIGGEVVVIGSIALILIAIIEAVVGLLQR